MLEEVKKIPKIELHIHLDGAISVDLASKLSGLSQEEVRERMVVKEDCKDLREYLEKFSFPISLMQTKENLELIAKDLVMRLEKENVIYAEIRFAPMFHTKEGLSYEEVVESVLIGLNTGKNIKANLILCLMRGMKREDNLKTLLVACKYLDKGVCAIDLAGDEEHYPIDNYLEFFEIAKSKKLPFTIHAGETKGIDEINKAIGLKTRRIGHGIHCIENIGVINLIRKEDILLEVCPTSNIHTNVINSYSIHPLYNLYKNNIKVCINTDNPGISGISLTDEYMKLLEYFPFCLDDFVKMNLYALENSFLSKSEKRVLKKKLKISI